MEMNRYMPESTIIENVQKIMASLPQHVTLEAAAKTRTADEAAAAVKGGVRLLGYNYVQEAESIKAQIDADVEWHLIGHLQKNKVKKAVRTFDMIETIDSAELAMLVDEHCRLLGKIMNVLIEVNSGRESQKAGAAPDMVESLIRQISLYENIRIKGLMTMGPWVDDPEELRPFFRETHQLFLHIRSLNIANVDMTVLSMGMSDSFRIAIEEGANLVRLGTVLFGPRAQRQA